KNPSRRTSSPLTVSRSASHAAPIAMTPREPGRTATPRQPAHLAAHEESRHAAHPPPGSLTSTPARRPAATPRRAPHDRWLSAPPLGRPWLVDGLPALTQPQTLPVLLRRDAGQ